MSSKLVPYSDYLSDHSDVEIWYRRWSSKYQPKYNPRYLREKNGEWKLLGLVGDTTPINDLRIIRALENMRKKWHIP